MQDRSESTKQASRGANAEDDVIYEEETAALGYNIAEYYHFAKEKYQHTVLWRIVVWELAAVWASLASYYVPFWAYGLGVANISGKTEDLFAASLAVYACNIIIHHM